MLTAYRDAASLAIALADSWPGGARVYPRPYNRFKWDESETWWLAPVPGPTTFQYAKIIVSSSARLGGSEQLFVGLYVEKGIGQSLAAAGYYRDDWVMQPDWSWHRVLRDLATGRFREPIAEASHRIDQPVEIRVDAHVPVVGGDLRPLQDLVAYGSTDGIRVERTAAAVIATEEAFLRQAGTADTLQDLATALGTIPSADSAWVNLHFGRSLKRTEAGDAGALEAHQVAARLIEPFAPWVA